MNLAPIIVLLGAVVLVGLIYLMIKAAQAHAERERQRKIGLRLWAQQNGFDFAEKDPWSLDERYNGVFDIGRGHDRYAFEVLLREVPARAAIFQYHYKTLETRTITERDANGNTRTRTETYEEDHWRRFLIVELSAAFPALALRGESWLDRVAGFIGFDDIDFESEAFSQAYHCKSADREFAYAVIHPQMMEWLMTQDFAARIADGLFLMDLSSQKHSAEGCQSAMALASGFVNRIPDFVWEDYGKRPALKLPDPVGHAPAGLVRNPELADSRGHGSVV